MIETVKWGRHIECSHTEDLGKAEGSPTLGKGRTLSRCEF